MILNEVCANCGKCCLGELNGTFKKCEWLRNKGCILTDEGRNKVCLVYPYVIIDDRRYPITRRIFLDTACPHWKLFVDQRDKITDDVDEFPASLGVDAR